MHSHLGAPEGARSSDGVVVAMWIVARGGARAQIPVSPSQGSLGQRGVGRADQVPPPAQSGGSGKRRKKDTNVFFRDVVCRTLVLTCGRGGGCEMCNRVHTCLTGGLWGQELSLNARHRSNTSRVGRVQRKKKQKTKTHLFGCETLIHNELRANACTWECAISPPGTCGGWYWKAHAGLERNANGTSHTQPSGSDTRELACPLLPYVPYRCTRPYRCRPRRHQELSRGKRLQFPVVCEIRSKHVGVAKRRSWCSRLCAPSHLEADAHHVFNPSLPNLSALVALLAKMCTQLC